MKKYNMHEIMANAWNIRRTNNVSMSTALRAAWALAKAINTAEEVAAHIDWNTKVRVNNWARPARVAPMLRLLSTPTLGTASATSRSAMSIT